MTILINQPHPSIDRLVEIFYGRAREDEIIGPIFNRTVKDWDHHLARISEFWSSVILKTAAMMAAPCRLIWR
ncbi:hypothetical protein C038_02591 [Brucella sp. 63/311]|nr:hypothetical protein C038_02591 [Brucella sp. 63/311]